MAKDLAEILPVILEELSARRHGSREPAPDATDAWLQMSAFVQKSAAQVLTSLRSAPMLDSDEVAQQVLHKLQSEAVVKRLVESKNPAAYLRGIIRHSALDAFRQMRLRTSPLTDLGDLPWLLMAHEAPEPPAPVETVLAGRLRDAMQNLSEKDRRLLSRRFWENQSIGEIAALEGATYSATAVRLFRLIRRLRAELESPVNH